MQRARRLVERATLTCELARGTRFASLFRSRTLCDRAFLPRYGTPVRTVDGQFLGTLAGLNSCCIEVVGERGRFTVEKRAWASRGEQIELNFVAAALSQHVCALHWSTGPTLS